MFVDLQQDWAAGVASRLAADGIARFDHIRTRTQFVTLGASLGRIEPHRDSADDGVTALENRTDLGRRADFEGFGTGALPPHTDRSGVIDPPALLLVVCGRKSTSGGECLVIDGRHVYADLTANRPEALPVLSRPRTVLSEAPPAIYVLHNHRWLHGRTAFNGERVVYRVSLAPHPEFAIPSGFEIAGTAAVG